MPPCGNFGLILLGKNAHSDETPPLPSKRADDISAATRESMRETSEVGGLRLAPDIPTHLYLSDMADVSSKSSKSEKKKESNSTEKMILERKYHGIQPSMIPPITIMESMTAMTEIRGGQAGGFSCIEFQDKLKLEIGMINKPIVHRVRLVSRKRHPLAADLKRHYSRLTGGHDPANDTHCITCIGHTRFATSSVNIVSELHPHEWSPFRQDTMWRFIPKTGAFERVACMVGIHLTHNGDFDAMEAYGSKMTVGEVGLWLERVLHVKNDTRGDSPKVAGMLELLAVQGRWDAAARLAWVRCEMASGNDVSGGLPLSKTAPNTFPAPSFFTEWGHFLEDIWVVHSSTVIVAEKPNVVGGNFSYVIDRDNELEFINDVIETLNIGTPNEYRKPSPPLPGEKTQRTDSFESYSSENNGGTRKFVKTPVDDMDSSDDGSYDDVEAMGEQKWQHPRRQAAWKAKAEAIKTGTKILTTREKLKAKRWDEQQTKDFVTCAVRGFLRGDLYSAMTELIGRAEGSFGLQVHSPCEPGVVVIASKGQPMSVAFDPAVPLVVFGSEAGALAVPIDRAGRWLPNRIDLDNHGEIIRMGEPRMLLEGCYDDRAAWPNWKQSFATEGEKEYRDAPPYMRLQNGIEFRSYNLGKAVEAKLPELLKRIIAVNSAPDVFDPSVDLVQRDLDATPAVLAAIDRAWSSPKSLESIAANSFCEMLVECMQERLSDGNESTDLVISGVEASLWIAEQWANDLRTIFPMINITTISSNKLLSLGLAKAAAVYFPGAQMLHERSISHKTCFLLISQSGQTFPSLHATFNTERHLEGERVWLLTATYNSKMELAIRESHDKKGIEYKHDRVFTMYCGHRCAEPASVVVAATTHTLSRLMLKFIRYVREVCPRGRMIHPWSEEAQKMTASRGGGGGSGGGSTRDRKTTAIVFDGKLKPDIVMLLSDGCINDLETLLGENLVSNVAEIVGVAAVPPIKGKKTIYENLVYQGKRWAEHVKEPWTVLCYAGTYIILSVGLGLPIFGLLGDAVVAIIRLAGVDLGTGTLSFSPRHPSSMLSQSPWWTLAGFLIQMVDAVWFVFLIKVFTWVGRLLNDRQLWARHGKRTIVIVDTPANHQMLESFVSKLYSQAYSHTSVDVHGASGLDHFVHRFTHRVSRGVLLAVGRPDGRLGCLAKSEMATLLSAKQAAFIQNPDYEGFGGSGPEIVTIGHNSFTPSLGLCFPICIEARKKRRQFIEEYLYERLHLADKPFTSPILKSLYTTYNLNATNMAQEGRNWRGQVRLPYGVHHVDPAIGSGGGSLLLQFMFQAKEQMKRRKQAMAAEARANKHKRNTSRKNILPTTFLEGFRLTSNGSVEAVSAKVPIMRTQTYTSFSTASSKQAGGGWQSASPSRKVSPAGDARDDSADGDSKPAPSPKPALSMVKDTPPSCDPAARMAFSLRFDEATQQIQNMEVIVQQLYESRVASLERYMAFCVMFHAMAAHSNNPWLCTPWDIARSQSNLRVATTASPVSLTEAHAEMTNATKKYARMMHQKLRGAKYKF